MPSEQLFKVLVIGGSQVGKTSFVKRCVGGVFTEFYKVTIGVDFAIKTIEWSNEEIVRLQFWDIQGQEDRLPITRAFFRDADACIMMFDVTSEKSFIFCEALKQAVDTEVPGKDGNPIPCGVLANKCDLAHRTVQPGAIADFANALNFFTWMEISVKENKRVEDSKADCGGSDDKKKSVCCSSSRVRNCGHCTRSQHPCPWLLLQKLRANIQL